MNISSRTKDLLLQSIREGLSGSLLSHFGGKRPDPDKRRQIIIEAIEEKIGSEPWIQDTILTEMLKSRDPDGVVTLWWDLKQEVLDELMHDREFDGPHRVIFELSGPSFNIIDVKPCETTPEHMSLNR
jgi:hypothetical protein